MLDPFDHALLNEVQRDDGRTADELARIVPLSPSAIARRLRRLRADGWIRRTVALLSPRFAEQRLQAFVFIILNEHADRRGKAALDRRLSEEPAVQFSYDVTGAIDMIALFDCANMAEFTAITDRVLIPDQTVRRYDAHFVRREVKFEPFVRLEQPRSG
jgi:Lrp/AsnC family transcriptional regulator, leucine-responsive regulatory protein